MSNLLSLLGMGSSAISAQNSGIATTTNNVANVNTVGYARETTDLNSLQGPPLAGGVTSGATSRAVSDLLSARVRTSNGSLASSQALSTGLSDVENSLTSGTTIDQRVATMFSMLNQVSASPTDKTLRDAAVSAAQSVVSSLHDAAGSVTSARSDADSQIGTIATQATALANQLAAANKGVASGDPTALDRRDQLANQLSQLVGGQGQIDSKGQMRFVLDGGAVLVDGTRASSMTTSPDPTTGLATVHVTDGGTTRDVTSQIGSGQLGGVLALRSSLTATLGQYDQYASDLATSFNSVASANAGADGVSGRNMFVPPTGVSGAAAALQLDPGLAANSDQLATAAVGGAAGSNAGAVALYALANQTVAGGGKRTLTDAALDITASIGEQTSSAKANATGDQIVSDHLGDLRDSISGVDIQEETTNLSKYEAATSAMTKFVSSIDQMLSSLIQNI
jgi:flagellar hook-associated protein 1